MSNKFGAPKVIFPHRHSFVLFFSDICEIICCCRWNLRNQKYKIRNCTYWWVHSRMGSFSRESTSISLKTHISPVEGSSSAVEKSTPPSTWNNNKVYIMDFNVSSVKKDDQSEFLMMTKTGTVAFSAPEIFTNSHYNCQVDLWSAGIVLYMMFCG